MKKIISLFAGLATLSTPLTSYALLDVGGQNNEDIKAIRKYIDSLSQMFGVDTSADSQQPANFKKSNQND